MKKALILVLFLLASTIFAANYKMVRSKSYVNFFIKSITIRGITRSKKGKGFYQASGNVVINRKKFDVTYGVFYNPISDNATVSFKINMAK